MQPFPATPFLAEILAHPEEDGPRLAAADAYEAAGAPERAEFIRVSCREARLPAESVESRVLASRRDGLLGVHREEWCGELEPGVEALAFARGFPERAFLFLDEVDESTADAMARWPIRELAGDGEPDPGKLRAFFARPELGHVTRLSFPLGTYDPEILAAAVETGLAGRLTSIEVGDGADASTVQALDVAAPRLRSLTVFNYMSHDFAEPGARALVESTLLDRLQYLALHNAGLHPEGVEALARAPGMRGLRVLQFSGGSYSPNSVGLRGAQALAESVHLDALEVLGLGHGQIGEDGIEALARTRHLRGLRELQVHACALTHEGFKHLGVSELIDQLVLLDLRQNGLGARALHPLLVSVPPALRILRIGGNPLGDEGVRQLAQSPLGDALTALDLTAVGMSDAGAAELARSTGFGALQSLSCDGNRLGDEAKEDLRARFGATLLGA